MRTHILGCGSYLPERIVTNDELAERMDTSDTWIRERTGIAQRHIAADEEYTSDLATNAAQAALAHAGIGADSIDGIIVATSTPDKSLPSTATIVQQKLGIVQGFAFDLNAACSGFVYALQTADAMLKAGQVKRMLVIGAETMSRVVDWGDRATCILFGDGAGAWVLDASDRGLGYLGGTIASDGQYGPILGTDGGVSLTKTAGVLHMQGKEVFRHAVDKMASASMMMLSQLGKTAEDVDWVIPHQANSRIMVSVMKKLGISQERLINCVADHANTSAATIPLAVDVAVRDGRIQKNHLLACPALGAGLTWGCSIIQW